VIQHLWRHAHLLEPEKHKKQTVRELAGKDEELFRLLEEAQQDIVPYELVR
jgi:hypothetical protein